MQQNTEQAESMELPAPLQAAIEKAFSEAYEVKPEEVLKDPGFDKFRDGFLVAYGQVHDLVIKNGNLTQSFLMMMRDLRTYTTWLIRSHIGGSIINGSQYEQAKFMQETLDQIAKDKKWNIIDENAIKL